jgi:hypothetical protein
VAQFLVEHYVSRLDGDTVVDRGAARVRVSAEEVSREGRPVRYLRSIFVPDEETCFFLFEAEKVEDVEEAARRASLVVGHAVVAIARGEVEP